MWNMRFRDKHVEDCSFFLSETTYSPTILQINDLLYKLCYLQIHISSF